MKKRKGNLKDETCLLVLTLPEIYTKNIITNDLNQIVKKFQKAQTVAEQVVLMPQLIEFIKPPASYDMEYIIQIFVYILLSCSPKHPLKKSITRLLSSLSNFEGLSKNISLEIARQLLHKITLIESKFDVSDSLEKIKEFDDVNAIVNNVNGCFENFQMGYNSLGYNTIEVFSFLVRALYLFTDPTGYIDSPAILQNLHQFIHNTTRALISTSQHLKIRNNIYKMYKPGINKRCVAIINNSNIPYDTKSNCGIIMILFANNTKESGYVDLLKICLEPEIPWFIDDGIKDVTSQIGIVCIFSGVLNVVKPEELLKNNSTYFYLITSKLTEILSNSANNPNIILGVNRTMLLVSKHIQELSLGNLLNLLNILLNYVWMNLDHGIDTVRHIARSIFINLIKLSMLHQSNGEISVLDNILKKTLSLPKQRSCRYRAISTLVGEIGTSDLLEKDENLVETLLKQMMSDAVSSEVVSCYEALMRAHVKEVSEETWMRIWVSPLLKQLDAEEMTHQTKCFQDLLTSAIKLKPMLLQNIFPERSLENTFEFCSLLRCALIARQLGKSNNTSHPTWRGLLQPVILEQAKYHQNDEIRISSLALICDSHKSTEIFSDWELSFIIKYLSYNIGSLLPSVRQQIVSLKRRILTRFLESYKLINRNITRNRNDSRNYTADKTNYESFFIELRGVLFSNIFYGANFTRRSLSLEILNMMRPIYELIEENWTEDEANLMMLCLTDSYENNKQLATKSLAFCPVSLLKLDNVLHTKMLLEKAVKMTYNVRPSSPMTAAYILETLMYSPTISVVLNTIMSIPAGKQYTPEYLMMRFLCIQLRCHYEMANSSLIIAVRSSPIHGIMFCVRHLLGKFLGKIKEQYWIGIFNEIIRVCMMCSAVVAPIVKNSSPEGHLPMDQKPVELYDDGDQNVTSQMMLVCAWRTIKEVSLLLSEICLKVPISGESRFGYVSERQVVTIGEHFCELLIEIRHRGAFEHAYIGFTKVLNCLWKSSSSQLNRLPIIWLQNIIQVISSETARDLKLCITRRSAGIPFMIQAIVSSELVCGGSEYFHMTMDTLIDFGMNSANVETRMHAMNILRALYRHTQLGEVVMPYLANGFKVAIIGFNKPSWGERNSATLLFASLMTRTFGVQRIRDTETISAKNRMTARNFNQKFPTLQPFLLNKLKEALPSLETNEMGDKEAILYPILNILSRLYPVTLEEEPKNSLIEFVPYVMKCAQGRIIKTRELAAKALSSIVYETSKIGVLNELLLLLEEVQTNNYLHGILLHVNQLVKDIPDIENSLYIINVIESTKWIISVPCPIVSALYMQILIQLPLRFLGTHMNTICLNLLEDIDSVIQNDETLGSTICLRASFHLKLHIISHIINIPLELRCLKIQEVLFHKFTLTTPALYNFSLNFLIYLFSDDKQSPIINSWDIPNEEKSLADLFTDSMRANMFILLSSDLDILRKTLYPFLKHSDIISSKTLAFLSYIPLIFPKINLVFLKNDIAQIVNMTKDRCDNNMTCASLMCLKQFDRIIFEKNLLKYSKLFWEFSNSNYSTACRYIIVEILKKIFEVFTTPQININEDEVEMLEKAEALCFLWQTVMKLLGDAELLIRNAMSEITQLCSKNSLPVIPDRAREILLQQFIDVMSPISEEFCLTLLLYWVFEDNNISEDDEQYDGQIFEKNDTGNTLVENQLMGKLAVKKLPQFFIGQEQNFFIEIQELLIECEHNFWTLTPEQKIMFTYYNKKINSELKYHGDFSKVKDNIKNSFDFWMEGEDATRWKYLDILQSFITSK